MLRQVARALAQQQVAAAACVPALQQCGGDSAATCARGVASQAAKRRRIAEDGPGLDAFLGKVRARRWEAPVGPRAAPAAVAAAAAGQPASARALGPQAGGKPLAGAAAQQQAADPSAPKVYVETYGCQMNVNDTEVLALPPPCPCSRPAPPAPPAPSRPAPQQAARSARPPTPTPSAPCPRLQVVMSILSDHGYVATSSEADADLVLLNTCSIRENAEQRVWGRLSNFKRLKQDRRKERR
jgi:hypothetical protein